ncbi:MAG TPA: AAC(3) family N-acetyltransferase [Armatimonadota bacterium]|jgi:aminoglycoside 3-N-acetyltransferase
MTNSSVTRSDIAAGLRSLGLSAGDTVLVHSSLKSFGHVEGGAETVIEALLEVVGSRGCIVMPTLTLGTSESPVVFDVRHSPSSSGRITEVFRQRPDAFRSMHPTSSAAAVGYASREITAWHGKTPCGLTSPYGQVYLRGGYCLFLGATFSSNTMFHVAEEIVMPRYLRTAVFPDATVIDENDVSSMVEFVRYNCYQSGVQRDLEKLEMHYESAGAVRHGQIGPSHCRLIRARDVIDISVDLLRSKPEDIFSYTK